MQTTLRIDDGLYRQAKAEAARQGITLTRFIEEALRLRLSGRVKTRRPVPELPSYDSGIRLPAGFDLEQAIRQAEAEADAASAAKSGA
jgi:hypothetical protein